MNGVFLLHPKSKLVARFLAIPLQVCPNVLYIRPPLNILFSIDEIAGKVEEEKQHLP